MASKIINANNVGDNLSLSESRNSFQQKHAIYWKKLLLKRVSLRGICKAIGISLRLLLLLMVNLYGELPDNLNFEIDEDVSDIIIEVVDTEVDELWSFVGKKEFTIGMDCNG